MQNKPYCKFIKYSLKKDLFVTISLYKYQVLGCIVFARVEILFCIFLKRLIMGMFLSQFSMLKALGYGEAGQMKDETEKILEPYKLFVLVLHDPEKHTSFHQKFSQLFERLDYLTGPNLLFMGIAKPSYDWYKRNENNFKKHSQRHLPATNQQGSQERFYNSA